MGIVGAILGDIAGSQYEFSRMRPDDLDWKHCDLFTKKCRFTDDTVMTIACHMAILEDKENPNFEKWYRNLGVKYLNVGYGSMFKQWIKDPGMGNYGSYGNGSAMRVSAVGVLYNNPEDVTKYAKLSALPTHNHPEGMKGAIVTAMCEHIAAEGGCKSDIYAYALKFYGDEDKYKYPVTMPLEEMRKIYKWDVTCQGSVPAAIRCVLEARSYEEFLRNVFSLKCDMDTLCAIGGGIAEELFGLGHINPNIILPQYLDEYLLDCVSKS